MINLTIPNSDKVNSLPERSKMPAVFWRAMDHLGLPPSAVLRQAGLPTSIYLNRQATLTLSHHFAIWKAVEELSGDMAFGLKLVTAAAAVGHKPSFLAACLATSYRDALTRIARFARLSALEELCFEQRGDEFLISKKWPCGAGIEPPVSIDMTFGFLLDLGRKGTGLPLTPIRLEYRRTDPGTDAYREHFNCPIHWNAQNNIMVLNIGDIDRPFTGHNPELLDILTPALLAAMSDFTLESTTSERVKIFLKRTLSGGRLDIAKVARELGMSGRTLQRRLIKEDTTFRALVTEARRELGQQLLRDPCVDLNEVSFLLGFQDTSSFYRAFREHEGMTPREWQQLEKQSVAAMHSESGC